MTVKLLPINPATPSAELELRNKGMGQFVEVGFDGTITGQINIFRRYKDNAGNEIAKIPLTASWATQDAAVITKPIAGLTFEGLIAESSIVFEAVGSVDGNILILGVA